MGNGRVSRGIRSGVVHGDFSTAAAGDVVVRARVTALVYEWSAISKEKFKSSGVSVEPPEEAKKFLDRVMRDCQVDRPHIPLDPYPCDCLPIPMPY
jgi:hypothetical protein